MISKDLDLAAKFLEEEEIIGFPTETVYGLAGNIYSEKAIRKIFSVKERPFYNPLIVHIKNGSELEKIATEIPEIAKTLAEKFWPGPLTLLLKKKSSVPDLITAGKPTVAVRVPNHAIALQLLEKLDFPLAAPSANPFGRISPTNAKHVDDYFGNSIKMVLEGGICETGIESTIIGFEGEKVIIYRLGGISLEEIENICGAVKLLNKDDKQPEAPGMLSKHYAPRTSLIFTENLEKELLRFQDQKIGVLSFNNTLEQLPENFVQIILSAEGNLKVAAAKLYETLHQMDQMNLEHIIAEKFPEVGLGRVINDKLRRASQP